MDTAKRIIVVTAKTYRYNPVRDILKANMFAPEWVFNVESLNNAIYTQEMPHGIIWDNVQEDTSLLEYIRAAKKRYPNAIMITVTKSDALRLTYKNAGCIEVQSIEELPENLASTQISSVK